MTGGIGCRYPSGSKSDGPIDAKEGRNCHCRNDIAFRKEKKTFSGYATRYTEGREIDEMYNGRRQVENNSGQIQKKTIARGGSTANENRTLS